MKFRAEGQKTNTETILVSNDFKKDRQAKISNKNRRFGIFGVIMTPLTTTVFIVDFRLPSDTIKQRKKDEMATVTQE